MSRRSGTTGRARGRSAMVAGLIIGLTGLVGACNGSPMDTLEQNATTEVDDADLSVVLGDLTEALGLTDDQIESVRNVFHEYAGQGKEPGMLWLAAADLQGILSSDQIEALEARRAQIQAEAKAHRSEMRSGRGPSAGAIAGLDLSDEQLAELKEIRESYAPEMDDIRQALRDGSLTRDEAKVKLEAIREAIHKATQGILTTDQLALLEEHKARAETRRDEAGARREEMNSQREERRGAEQAAMVEALGLTAEQVAAIDALRESFSVEGRPSPGEMEARRDEHRQAMMDILSDDQEEIWILHGSLSGLFARHRVRGRTGDGFGGRARAAHGAPGRSGGR